MAEYIEREALLEKLAERDLCLCVSESDIKNMPAADVAPVVHGRWVDNGIPGSMLSGCSVCGFSCGAFSFSYCPHCGAKMDKEELNGD